jgi:hypothetical protein
VRIDDLFALILHMLLHSSLEPIAST